MAIIRYKQCYLHSVISDDDPYEWESVCLIELKDIKPEPITLIQYKVTRKFEIITVYPQIIKKTIINKTKGSQSTTKQGNQT